VLLYCFWHSSTKSQNRFLRVTPAAEAGTDIGNVGRNVLRGPHQRNVYFSVGKRFPLAGSRILELHADFLTFLNHPHRDNPSATSALPISVKF
jgi:hypothetical protein